jgi:hypothetical protein
VIINIITSIEEYIKKNKWKGENFNLRLEKNLRLGRKEHDFEKMIEENIKFIYKIRNSIVHS